MMKRPGTPDKGGSPGAPRAEMAVRYEIVDLAAIWDIHRARGPLMRTQGPPAIIHAVNTRTASRLVWALSLLIALIYAAGYLWPAWVDSIFMTTIAVPFLIVGALVARRRPQNPVGWLFLAFSAVAAFAFTAMRYWASGPAGAGSRPGAALVASLGVHLWHPSFSLFILSFLLFPDGRLPSRFWIWPARLTAGLGVIGVVSGMLEHDFYKDFMAGEPVLPTPLVTGPIADVAAVVFGVCVMSLLVMLAVSTLSIFIRFRKSSGIARQQIKWVMAAITAFAIALPASLILLGHAYGSSLLPLIPISAGIAILRYRLFDIDVIINRALVYGALTAALVLVYAASVVAIGAVAGALSPEGNNNFAVAGSTLVVAALFGPFRRSVQAFIDRRFYRHKYNAEQTVAQFSARLRDQLDLESLNAELTAVVAKTVQPSHVSVWLKSSGH